MKDGIFVSYSHKDTAVVEQIVSVLKETCGMDVWFDHKLRGGENYFSVIANQIIENKYFVFIVSDNSVKSDWCLRELEFAASERRHIVAIWLDNITIAPRIKLIIQNTHYINWYSNKGNLFSQSIALAFNGDAAPVPETKRDNDDALPKNQKYFLCKDELKKLKELLAAEKNETFSVCFIPENANLLGIAYELGISVEADLKKAALYYKVSKYGGNRDGAYLYASLMFQNEPENEVYLSDMIEAAESGSALALTHVGDFHYEGRNGLPVNKEKAYTYYERAAKAGDIMAMYYTAYGYRKGECLPQDLDIAYMYALKAMEKGFPRAFRLLAFMYEDGQYVEKDLQKAIELYEEAIERGDNLSNCYVGYVYGLMGQIEKKAELYKKAAELAEAGEIKSGTPFYRLAFIYEKGEGVEKNLEAAVENYLKGAEKNNKLSLKWTVPCILRLNSENKETLLKKAYELKCEKAAYELGKIEKAKRKDNKEKLSDKAVKYFEAGAELGEIDCALELLWNYSFIIGNGESRKDREEAIKWFRFFFANIDEEFIETYRKYNLLANYYYAYAIELDYDPEKNLPDREFVLYNFKKSLEESPVHLSKIINFAVKGYLFPDESKSGFPVDVKHTEDILALAKDHMSSFSEYLKNNKPDEYEAEWKKTRETLKKGYSFISKCYRTGKHVMRDKIKAAEYEKLAQEV